MQMCVSESVCISCAFSLFLFLFLLLFPIMVYLFLFYYILFLIVSFKMPVYFLMVKSKRECDCERKGRCWKEWGRRNSNQNILYEKKSIFNG